MKKINDVKKSLSRSTSAINILIALESLADTYKDISESELLEYVPIKIVSCFEEHFRQIYKEIIDRPEFKKNVTKVKCLKNAKLDLDLVDDMISSNVSLSDYLSYNFPCSSIEQVFEQLGTLLNIDFQKSFIDKTIEIEGKVEQPEDVSRENIIYFIKSIGIIFTLRHNICHEGYFAKKFDNGFIMQMIDDALTFIQITDQLIYDTLYSDSNITQYDMNTNAEKSFNDAESELLSIIEYLKNNDPEVSPNFDYLASWKEFRNKKAESDSLLYDGGSIYKTVYYMSMEATTHTMIDQLKREYKLYEWRLNDIID